MRELAAVVSRDICTFNPNVKCVVLIVVLQQPFCVVVVAEQAAVVLSSGMFAENICGYRPLTEVDFEKDG